MADDGLRIDARIANQQRAQHFAQRCVLGIFVGHGVCAFELDADGEVVAAPAASIAGSAGVPGSARKRNELGHGAGAVDEGMGRHPQPFQISQARVRGAIKLVAEQGLDGAIAKLPRRKRDAMHDDEGDVVGVRASILIRRWRPARAGQPAVGVYNHAAMILDGQHAKPAPPPPEAVRRSVQVALEEDIGAGDVTAALIDAQAEAAATVISRSAGVFCGRPWAVETCRQVDPSIEVRWRVEDGDAVRRNAVLLELRGRTRSLLTAERTLLNFAQLLSGTATAARACAAAVAGTNARILDTRKTAPGLRVAQKYAVAVGGATNHRQGLFDAFLIKENHIAAAGGIAEAVRRARASRPELFVEVEVENLAQFQEALASRPDCIMLDNFSMEDMALAVRRNDTPAKLEASGGLQLADLAAVAVCGVDYISVGAITKRIEPLDLSMRLR